MSKVSEGVGNNLTFAEYSSSFPAARSCFISRIKKLSLSIERKNKDIFERVSEKQLFFLYKNRFSSHDQLISEPSFFFAHCIFKLKCGDLKFIVVYGLVTSVKEKRTQGLALSHELKRPCAFTMNDNL